ncbi:MAG TPA: flagellar basal body rod protein FlgB [Gammaproteobacteria bacterium]|nr:flagellar basal body rod protein FlgB [Gammaproteobacteria bacterium]
MPMNFDSILGPHEKALNMQAYRARIIGANLANADTPGYKARDIDFKSALSTAESTAESASQVQPLTRTNAMHIEPDGTVFGAELLYRQPLQPALDGNTVEPQVEMAEFTENAMRYLTSLRIVNGRFNKMLTAIRGE